MVGTGDPPGDEQKINAPAPTQGNAPLPSKQQQSIKSMANNNNVQHQNQQNSNPQTAMSGGQTQQQQANAVSSSSQAQGVQPASQQQLTQQQQIGSRHANQSMPSQNANQPNNLMQQPVPVPVNHQQQDSNSEQNNFQQQHLQTMPIQGSQSFQQISPPQNSAPYNTPSPLQQAQNQQAQQVLQQIPQQPLFQQQQAGSGQQQNVIISPQQQHHVVMQHTQIMQPPQLQQQQPYQQQLQQQPMTMLQTPILSANAPGTNSPQKSITKGRFRIVKSSSADNQSVASSNDTQVGAEKTPQPISTVKKGRFVVKKPAVVEQSKSVPAGKGNSTSAVPTPATTIKPAEAKVSCMKKKGRFLVKTGGSAANLPAMEATKPLPTAATDFGAEASSAGMEPEKGPKQQNTSGVVDETDIMSSTKKKGRFVVKTGGAPASSPAGGHANALSAAPEGMQNTAGIGNNAPIVQLTPNPQQLPNYIAGTNIPIPLAGMPAGTSLVDANGQMMPTTSLVDVNGQMMVVSNVALPLSQAVHQHHLQQMPVSQQPQVQSQFVNPPVLSPPQQAPTALSDAHSQLPPASRSRAGTDERALENSAPKQVHVVPRANNRPAGSSGSSWSSAGTRAPPMGGGKNGRLIGGGGVGKVLHNLDVLRSEVVEADRCIFTLQSDNRFLRDKNKELEAKNKDLERRLHAAEAKCRSLINEQVKVQGMNNAIQPQRESGAHQSDLQPAPSADGRLENRSSASFEDLQPITENQKQPSQKESSLGNNAPQSKEASKSPIKERSLTEPETKPLSRNNNLDASDLIRRGSVGTPQALCQSMSGLSQFDPLGTAPPSSINPTNHCVSVAQTCISAMTMASINNENVAIPLIVTTQAATSPSPPPPPPNMDDTPKTYANITRTKHFDPLGTPERSHVAAATVTTLVGLPQIPAMATHINNGNSVTVPVLVPLLVQQRLQQHQQQPKPQQEDPFDEIVRLSHSHGTT